MKNSTNASFGTRRTLDSIKIDDDLHPVPVIQFQVHKDVTQPGE